LKGFMSFITLERMAWLRPMRSVRDSPVRCVDGQKSVEELVELVWMMIYLASVRRQL
jgi:hypothetical protein